MPPNKSAIRLTIKILILVLMAYAASACTTQRSAPEPKFKPIIYVTAPNECKLIRSDDLQTEITPANEKIWNTLYCAPVSDLRKIKAKFQACKVWK